MSSRKPEKTKIEMLKSGGALTILVPRQGFDRVFGPALIMGFMFLAIGCIPFCLNDAQIKKQMNWTFPHFALLTFPTVGAVAICMSFFGALRRTVIVAADGSLVITRTSLLMKTTKSWEKSKIFWVSAEESNVKVNNRRLWQLRVHLGEKKKAHFLTGRDEYELKWIASELQQALGFTSPAE